MMTSDLLEPWPLIVCTVFVAPENAVGGEEVDATFVEEFWTMMTSDILEPWPLTARFAVVIIPGDTVWGASSSTFPTRLINVTNVVVPLNKKGSSVTVTPSSLVVVMSGRLVSVGPTQSRCVVLKMTKAIWDEHSMISAPLLVVVVRAEPAARSVTAGAGDAWHMAVRREANVSDKSAAISKEKVAVK